MRCRYDNETAFRRAKGHLAEEARVEYDGHLATCARCADRFLMADATVRALKAGERGPTPEVDWARVYRASKAAFVEGHARAIEGPRVNLRLWIPAAAAVAAALALVVWGLPGGDGTTKRDEGGAVARGESRTRETADRRMDGAHDERGIAVVTPSTGRVDGRRALWRITAATRGRIGGVDAREGDAVAVGEKISTGPNGTASVVVGAASRIEVAAASVVVPRRITETRTELELERGKLTAHIAPKGADGKFAVSAGAWRVEVTGTVFSVEVRGSDVYIETKEGAVKVTGPGLGEPRVVVAGDPFDSVTCIKKPIDVRPERRLRGAVRRGAATGVRAESSRRETEKPRAVGGARESTETKRARPASRELRREVDEFRRAGEEMLREYDR
ncbi:MAG: FecR domain-containing protein [Deltaproteobacteria bacterium]|nr:FecR domain-containing protein [Deltaproteobacteria bacterium]